MLDTVITVPRAEPRLVAEHIQAICGAVKAATGVRLANSYLYIDQAYAHNGLVPDRNTLFSQSQEARRPYSFSWGASAVPARDALISLLQGSATTIVWDMLCDPFGCALNLTPLTVTVTGPDGRSRPQLLRDDRCTNCRPLRPPMIILNPKNQ